MYSPPAGRRPRVILVSVTRESFLNIGMAFLNRMTFKHNLKRENNSYNGLVGYSLANDLRFMFETRSTVLQGFQVDSPVVIHGGEG
jgi:hypothetical protein